MADDTDDPEKTRKISFRVSSTTADELERTINHARAVGVLDLRTSRSELYREATHDIIEDLQHRINAAHDAELPSEESGAGDDDG